MATPPSIAAGARVAGGTLVRVPAPLSLLAWVALASLLQLVRAPGLPPWRVLWAEDGTVFLQQALEGSFLQTAQTTYAGYLHLVPRLLAEPATWFAPTAAAVVIAASGALTASLLAAYVWVASRSLFETRTVRALTVALFLFATPATIEFAGTLSNLHWYGLFASFFALLHRPASRREAAAAAAVVALTALSDPMLALLAPLLLLRPGGPRRAQLGGRVIPAAALGGLAVQAVAILGSAGPGRQSAFSAIDLPAIYAQRVAGPAMMGDAWFGQLWLAVGRPAAWIALALLAAIAVRAATHGSAEPRRHARLAVAGSLVLLAVSLVVRGTTELAPEIGVYTGAGARYAYLPLLLAWVPLLLLADRAGDWGRRVTLLLVLLVTIPSFAPSARGVGPDWADGLSDARRACAAGAPAATVRIAPRSADWRMTLPCSKL